MRVRLCSLPIARQKIRAYNVLFPFIFYDMQCEHMENGSGFYTILYVDCDCTNLIHPKCPPPKTKIWLSRIQRFWTIFPHFQMKSQSCLPSKVVFSHPASENRLWGEQAKYSCKSVFWISHWRGAFLEIVMHLISAFTTYQTPK